jgi:hypothetical protein
MGAARAERDRAIDHRLRGFDIFTAEIAKCEGSDTKRLRVVGSGPNRSMRKINPLATHGLPVLGPAIEVELSVGRGGPGKGGTLARVPLDCVPKQVKG